jgi:Ca2+-binding EF-hand superfamily protein
MAFNGLSHDVIEDLREAFKLCDTDKTGVIRVEDLLDALHCLDYDQKTKVLYQAIKELNTDEIRLKGLKFDILIEKVNSKLISQDNKELMRRLYDILTNENDNPNSITFESLKNTIIHDLGSYMSDLEIEAVINKVGKNKKEITYEDFCLKLSNK